MRVSVVLGRCGDGAWCRSAAGGCVTRGSDGLRVFSAPGLRRAAAATAQPLGPPLKLATWNVNSLAVRLPQLVDWLGQQQPEVLVLQETKLTDDKFPQADITAAGWHSVWFGQKTYNGVALLSRTAPQDVVHNIPGFDDPQARVIAATVDGLRVVGAYFPNGQAPGSEKFAYKMGWLQALQDWLRAELARHPHLVLMGDFNIAPDDRDVFDPVAWAGQIHCTPEERAHFQALCGLGLVDAFRLFDQPPRTWSWWDYRNLAFRKNQGLRIDHILVSQALQPRVTACTVDKMPRKNERPSDHAPVLATLAD
jgi:exodeoxyribonuclease-3